MRQSSNFTYSWRVTALVATLALAALTVWTPVHGLHRQEVCTVGWLEGALGTVETVRDVPMLRDLHGFDSDAFTHSVVPEVAEEIAVRLDVGPIVLFTQREPHGLSAGQRVRVELNGSIARVERDLSE